MKRPLIFLFILLIVNFSAAVYASQSLPKLPRDDEAFLEEIQRRAFEYFWNEANPKTGIVYDANTKRMGGSIASIGFALSAICVADSRGWVGHDEAYNRVLTTIKSFHRNPEGSGDFCVDGYCGIFFHFIDPETGKWYKNADCVSTADTADLIAGIITCMEYFKGTEIEKLGDEIVRACEWDSFLKDNNGASHKFIAMGCLPSGLKSSWTNEKGFFGRYYGYTDNSFLIYLLGIASPTHPIPASSWYACQAAYKRQTYNGRTVIVPTPPGLAFHYYHHCWLDLKNKKDQVADYFKNSLFAVLAQQEYCLKSEDYKNGLWGISSSLSPRGYEAMSAPFADAYENGTVAPYAIAGAMVFTPSRALDTLKYLAASYGDMLMGKYGFGDAFNQKRMWVSRDYLGIDQGVMILMIENFRTGLIWKYFSRNSYIEEAMKKIGFTGIIEDFENDPGHGAYSEYEILENKAVAKIDSGIFMEGRRSLRLDPLGAGAMKIKIRPELNDFSGFKYISLWARNSRNARIAVTDTKNNTVTLDCSSYLDSAGWRRYFYNLERLDGVDAENISDIVIMIIPADDKSEEPVYIDGVELTYAATNSNPQEISGIGLAVVEDSSICKISFGSSAGAHRYDIRYSKKPILSQADFENLPVIDRIFFATGEGKEEFFVPIASSGRYYAGVQAVDYIGQRSKVESSGPVEIKGQSPSRSLDDFERPGLSSGAIEWPAHKGYTLSISSERASRGKRSLKAEFHKVPADPWDYIELVFKKPLDLRPFRYLKIDVFGEDAVLAKLYNSKEAQEEIGVLRPLEKDKWNELIFDIAAMPGEKADKSRVTKLLLFIAPGRSSSGTMYLDNIRLDN